jgi:hypothetical protein
MTKRTVKILKIVLLTVLVTPVLLAQTNEHWKNAVPTTISPQAYSFTKYGDVPVSAYTGVPDISIPIYSIEAAGIQVPIGLSYHGNGIKVAEEASWVGLGWTLNAGGSIVQSVNGYDDFGNFSFDDPVDFSGLTIPGGIGCSGTLVPYSDRISTFDSYTLAGLNDTEPDIFSFNFLSYSGQFVFDKSDKTFKPLDDTNVKITSDKSPSKKIPDMIYITVPDGHKFVFQRMDVTTIDESYGISVSSSSSGGTSPPVDLRNQASSRVYQLTVIYTNKGEFVYFQYKTAFSTNYPSISQSFTRNVWLDQRPTYWPGPEHMNIFPPTVINTNFVASSQTSYYLQSILSSKVKIDFVSSSDRNDLVGALRLNRIEIRNNVNNSNLIKSFELTYDYFDSNLQGNTINSYLASLGITKTENEKNLRLKLASFKEVGMPAYTMAYSSKKLPSKISLAYDHWGFFNGNFNGSILSRGNANKDFADAAILKSISYPTGGKTDFEFESNELNSEPVVVNFYKQENGNVTLYDNNVSNPYISNYGTSVYKPSQTGFWLLVEKAAEIDIHPIMSLDGACSSNPQSNTYYPYGNWEIRSYNSLAKDLVKASGWSSIPTFVTNQNYLIGTETGKIKTGDPLFKDWGNQGRALAPGVYFFSVGLNDACGPQNTVGQNGFVYLKVEYKNTVLDYNETATTKGAGLRIREIKNYSGNNVLTSSKRYNYHNPVLMSNPEYESSEPFLYQYDQVFKGAGVPSVIYEYRIEGTKITRHSNSVFAISNNASGKFVGYGRVEVVENDFGGGTGNGKRVYEFQNVADSRFYHSSVGLIKPSRKNGIPLMEQVFDENGFKLRQEEFQYSTSILPCFTGFKSFWQKKVRYGQASTVILYENIYGMAFYPISRAQTFLTSKTTTTYSDGLSNVVIENLEYDAKNQIKKRTTVDSKNVINEVNYSYPYDLEPETIATQMVQQNYITPVLVLSKKLGGQLIYNEKTDYKEVRYIPNTMLNTPISIYDKAKISNKYAANDDYKTLVDYTKYYENNLLEYIGSDGVLNCLIWGYNRQYIVASISGAGYYDALALVDQSIIQNPSSDEVLRAELNKIRIGLPSARVTTYTHKPLIGLNSVTDANGIVQFFEYDSNNRLLHVKDPNGNIVSKYDYNFIDN